MNGSLRACAIVAALSGVGAAACDGGSGGLSGSNGDIENACDLLTTNEVTAFMATPMYGGEKDTDSTIPGTYCTWTSKDYVGEEQENPEYAIFVDEASTGVGDRIMTVGVSGNDLHPVSDDEAKRLERAAAELIVDRLRN